MHDEDKTKIQLLSELRELRQQLDTQQAFSHSDRVKSAGVFEPSLEQCREFFINAPIGITTTSPEGQLLSANPAMARMFGYDSPDDLIKSVKGLTTQLYADLSDREEFLRLLEENDEVLNYECRGIRRDKSTLWISINASVVRDKNGQIIHYQSFLTDITERKLLEEEKNIITSEVFDLYENAPCGYHSLDKDGFFVRINATELSWLGYARDEIIGKKKFTDLLTAQSVETFKKNFPALTKHGYVNNLEFEMIRKDDTILPVILNATAVKDASGNYLMSRSTIFDITERKQTEEKLRESEEKHRRLFETMALGVVYHAADGTIISANPAAERILGLSLDQIRGMKSMDPRWKMIKEDGTAVPGSEHPAMISLRTAKTFGPVDRGVFHPDKDDYLWLSITAIPLFQTGETKPFQAYATFEDITARKQAEKALLKSQKIMAQAEELAGLGSWEWDITNDTWLLSDNWKRIHGVFDIQLTTPQILPIIHPDDRLAIGETLAKAAEEGKPYDIEHRIVRQDTGEIRYGRAKGIHELDDSGKPKALVGAVQDISARKRVEQQTEIRLKLIEYAANHSLNELVTMALDEIERFLNSSISFLHFVEPDQQTLSLQQWSTATIERFCTAEGKGLHYDIDLAGVWADCLRERQGMMHNDYTSLLHKKGLPDGHPEILREMVVPIKRQDEVVAIMCVGNKPEK